MRRLVLGLLIACLALGGFAMARGDVPCEVFSTQPACDVALRPGPTEDTLGLVTVDGAEAFPPDGELRLTTIAVQDDLTFRSWVSGRTSAAVDIVPRERIYPPGSDREQVTDQNAALMADSQLVATIAALTAVGFELDGDGALVAAVTEDAVTADLDTGDVIVAVDGGPVADSQDVVDAVRASEPGATLVLEVEGEDGSRDVEVTLGATPEDESTPYIGVLLTTDLELPIDVNIDAGVIGGPSAGMMFALSIVELLGEEDLTDGRVIAGTGTVDRDGRVGAVGGVRQKLAGASAPEGDVPGASVFLLPTDNLPEARGAVVATPIEVVPVDTLDDALDALDALREGRTPPGAFTLTPGG